MQYATNITGDINDYNYNRFVGLSESNDCIKDYFDPNTVKIISHKISQLLDGVEPSGRKIIVPDKTIYSVLSQIYNSYRPPTGDIYGRYNVPTDVPENYIQSLCDQTIEVIVNDVKNNIGIDELNSKLSIWTTVLGDFNNHGLRQYPPIKIRERNTNFRGMVQFMNY
jgi:hypothetical protein